MHAVKYTSFTQIYCKFSCKYFFTVKMLARETVHSFFSVLTGAYVLFSCLRLAYLHTCLSHPCNINIRCIGDICDVLLSQIKLVNINATDIADGRPSIVLGLMWTIILYFQVNFENNTSICVQSHACLWVLKGLFLQSFAD